MVGDKAIHLDGFVARMKVLVLSCCSSFYFNSPVRLGYFASVAKISLAASCSFS